MTDTPKDIVGIVRELQESTEHCDVVEKQIVANFPSIAQALLIATRPLLAHEQLVRGECLEGCVQCEALSELRSLPTHD